MLSVQGLKFKGVWQDTYIAFALFAGSLILRFLIIAPSGFDGLYGQDSYAYFDFAGELLGFAKTLQPPGPFFWPIGYPLVLALGFAALGTSVALGQILNILLGALLSPLVYSLARQLGGGQMGALAAGLLMALCGQALQSSIVLMSDIPALAWATIGAVVVMRYFYTDRRRWLALAAFVMAVACITRWIYLLPTGLWGLAVLAWWWQHFNWRKRLLDLIAAGIAVVIVAFPQLYYNEVNPNASLDHTYVRDWSPNNAFQREFTTVEGNLRYEKITAIYYAQVYYDALYLSPLLTPFLLIGAWIALQRKQIVIIAWAVLPYVFLVGIPAQNIRFPLIVFPAVAVLVGIGLDAAISWLEQHYTENRILYRFRYAPFALLLVIGCWQMLNTGVNNTKLFIANQQRDKAVVVWATAQIPEDAILYTFGLTPAFRHYSTFEVLDIYNEAPPALLRQRWHKGRDDFLLMNVDLIEGQWGELSPGVAYHWLQDERGLVTLDKFGNYTLFRVKG